MCINNTLLHGKNKLSLDKIYTINYSDVYNDKIRIEDIGYFYHPSRFKLLSTMRKEKLINIFKVKK